MEVEPSQELIFKEGKDIDGEPIIEVGNWAIANNGFKFISSFLCIYPDRDYVLTMCGDSYYDYSIDFDTFLEIAEKIKELRNKIGKMQGGKE